jgi:hypothetical protein
MVILRSKVTIVTAEEGRREIERGDAHTAGQVLVSRFGAKS